METSHARKNIARAIPYIALSIVSIVVTIIVCVPIIYYLLISLAMIFISIISLFTSLDSYLIVLILPGLGLLIYLLPIVFLVPLSIFGTVFCINRAYHILIMPFDLIKVFESELYLTQKKLSIPFSEILSIKLVNRKDVVITTSTNKYTVSYIKNAEQFVNSFG